MVDIKDIRKGNLIMHKKIGMAIVVDIEYNPTCPQKSIIHGMDHDDSIYSGPCEDWNYLWAQVQTKHKPVGDKEV